MVVFRLLGDPLMNLLGYLDPGTGSLLLQFLIAGFFSVVVMVKVYWQAIVDFFRSKSSSKATDETSLEERIVESEEQTEDKADKKAA